MTTTSGLLVDADVPQAPPSPAGAPAGGFVDCRGHWHSWTDEGND